MSKALRRACAVGILLAAATSAAPKRATLLPRLRKGQIVLYQIRLRVNKQTRSESRVAMPGIAEPGALDVNRTIRAEVLEVGPLDPRAKLLLRIEIQDPAAVAQPTLKSFQLAIRQDGTVVPPNEAADLSPEDAVAWQAWLERFALAWTFPKNGVKPGDKWSAEESIAGTPLTGLFWKKESRYVRDDPCPAAQAPPERCAVMVATAILKQRSSPKNATPDEFKLRQLRTTGTAKGRNEVFTYISLTSGIVVRSSEEAGQFMDVVIAKADGSNRVHYNIDAKSSTEMLLVRNPL